MGYRTIYDKAQDSFIERKSEFIGYIAPVKTNDEAVEFINSIKALNRKATHNVYAYILRDNNITRYSDDGEPQGTAGVPVLDVLVKEGLTDICVVVTRYFGGILLGGGGLVRAYSHGCKIAVDAARIMDMCSCYELIITMNYNLYGKASYVFPQYEVKVLNIEFGADVKINLLVKSENADSFEKELVEITNGRIEITRSFEKFADFA